MAYDEELAHRFRELVGGLEGLSEKRMMGGICFLVNGNMIGGADRAKTGERRFMFRVGKDNQEIAETLPGGNAMVQGGRRMSGFYFVDADDHDDQDMKEWVSLAVSHAITLPAK